MTKKYNQYTSVNACPKWPSQMKIKGFEFCSFPIYFKNGGRESCDISKFNHFLNEEGVLLRRGSIITVASVRLQAKCTDKWAKDKDNKYCMIGKCLKKFGWHTRRHHCRFCGNVVCNGCSQNQKEGKRICVDCEWWERRFKMNDKNYESSQIESQIYLKMNDDEKTQGEENLWIAAREGDLSEFVDNQIEFNLDEMNEEGHSLLYVAARNGHLSIVQWIVTNGAEIDLQ